MNINDLALSLEPLTNVKKNVQKLIGKGKVRRKKISCSTKGD